jgi:hypothetical protein
LNGVLMTLSSRNSDRMKNEGSRPRPVSLRVVEVGEPEHDEEERDDGHDHRVGGREELLPLQVVDAHDRPAQTALLVCAGE